MVGSQAIVLYSNLLLILLSQVGCSTLGEDVLQILERLKAIEDENRRLNAEVTDLRESNVELTIRIQGIENKNHILKDKVQKLEVSSNQLADTNKRCVNRINGLQSRLKQGEIMVEPENLRKFFHEFDPFTISKQKRLLEPGVPELTSHRIAFSASLSHHVALGNLQPIEYDQVLTNLGNGYDPNDGHFIAPVRGLYLLSATAFNTNGHTQPIEMVRNGNQIASFFMSSTEYNMGAQTVILVLEKSDKVWVRRYQSSSSGDVYGTKTQPINTFSGVLLYDI